MTHLSPEALAGYLDNDLPGEERRQAELHLASCRECREELAEVRRLRPRHGGRWALVLIPATAAAVLLAIVLPQRTTVPSESIDSGARPVASAVRAGPADNAPLEIVSPAPSTEIAPDRSDFSWRSAGPGASYTFTLQEAGGRVVWTSTVSDTVAVLPDSIALGAGGTWFWSVDALLPDGASRSTGVKRLTTRP
jgi:anti-sigma factor RsiW